MKENSYKTIRNGVIITVLGGVILAIVTSSTVRTWISCLLQCIWSGIKWCFEAIMASYSFPGWAWLIIFSLSGIGVINIYLAFRENHDNGSTEPVFKSYTTDMIFGARWRWEWSGNDISEIWCYCPTCDATLVYQYNLLRLH